MKKQFIYSIIVVAFAAAAIFIVANAKSNQQSTTADLFYLQPRKVQLSDSSEWETMRKRAFALQQAIRNNPSDNKSLLALASLFLQEARITGNNMYYDKAAMHHVNTVLENDSLNFEALSFKAMILLSQHHFADGLVIAEKAKNINPYNAFIYGILVDGNVEMGNYKAAIDYADKMVSIRPDIRSYSRISYLREIYGDYPGAIEAMKLAINAGAPGDETTAWCRIQLGKLYEVEGDTANASLQYQITNSERPNYVNAIAGMARIAVKAKDYKKAIGLYETADKLVEGFTIKEELAAVYSQMDEKEKASMINNDIITEMDEASQKASNDETIGHYADLELANAYLKIDNTDKALFHALQEYNRRPGNIEVNEVLAWIYYLKSDNQKSIQHLKAALETNSKNPRLLCRAGMIYAKNGEASLAKNFLTEAKKLNISDKNLLASTEALLKTL